MGSTWDNGAVSQPTKQRPPQVSLASGLVMFSSVVVLLTAWERVTSLRSLETQEAIRDVLAEAPFTSLGLTVSSTTDLLRVSCMVAAACACATAILGWYVRKPDRSSRLALTLIAVVVFLTGIPAGGLAGSFVAAGAAMLWMHPAREWFATGRWTPPPPREPAPSRSAPSRHASPATRSGQAFPPFPPTSAGPRPAASPYGEHRPAPVHPPHRRPGTRQGAVLRPGAVVTAFVLTVVMAGGLLALSVMWIAIAGLAPDLLARMVDEQQPDLTDAGLTVDELRGMMLGLAGGFIVWCSVALVLAGFVMARRDWARKGLMAVAALSAGACLALLPSTVLVVVPAVAAVVTVVCLRRVEVRRWFSVEQH